MKRIIAFGNSNTWGYDAKTRGRYSSEVRWTGIVQKKLFGAEIIEEGFCGRTTVFDRGRKGICGLESLCGLENNRIRADGAIIMLGTNDCKTVYNAEATDIGRGMEQCLNILENIVGAKNILLVSPILLGDDVYTKDPDFGEKSVKVCRQIREVYREISEKHGTEFLDAAQFAEPCKEDSEHLDEKGHYALALGILGSNFIKSRFPNMG